MPTNTKKTKDRIDCLWGLVCSLSSIDQQRNNISLFNVIDQLTLPKTRLPKPDEKGFFMINLEHEIVFVWRRLLRQDLCKEVSGVDLKISSIDPNGKVLSEIATQLNFKDKQRIVRVRVQTGGFKISTEGDYLYRVEIIQPGTDKFEKAFEIPYNVRLV